MFTARSIGFAAALCSFFVTPVVEAGRADDRAKVEALETRLGEMFGRMNDSDPQARAAAHEAFQSFRLTDEEFGLLYERYRYQKLLVDRDSDDDLERTVDVIGVALLYEYHNVPAYGRLDAAWREYFRYLDDPSPKVRAIAFRRAADSQIRSIDLLSTALRGCADPVTAVRSSAFYMLGELLSEVPRDDPRFAEARELVSRAFQNDREVNREGLFLCARFFGSTMQPYADEFYFAMYGKYRFDAAQALAAVDNSSEMIDRVVAGLAAGDDKFERAAAAYFHSLPLGRGAKSDSLVVQLTKWLLDPSAERRLAAVNIILLEEFPTLRQAALAEAERLITQAPEHDYIWRESLAEAVFHCGLKHTDGRSTMRKFLRHPSNEIRCVAHNVLFGQFPAVEAYRSEIVFAVKYDPDPECRRIARLTLDALDATLEGGT